MKHSDSFIWSPWEGYILCNASAHFSFCFHLIDMCGICCSCSYFLIILSLGSAGFFSFFFFSQTGPTVNPYTRKSPPHCSPMLSHWGGILQVICSNARVSTFMCNHIFFCYRQLLFPSMCPDEANLSEMCWLMENWIYTGIMHTI